MSALVQTRILKKTHEVHGRVRELGMHVKGLLRIRDVALGAAADATDFHPANAAGTFAYQQGTWAMRDEWVGDVWRKERENGVEAIRNDGLNVRVIFTNVDSACDDNHKPQPRSPKGAGTEQACSGNLFPDSLPSFAPKPGSEIATYYIMVDRNGKVELSRPVVQGGEFTSWIERIYLPDDDSDFGGIPDLKVEPFDIEPVVVRK